MRPGERSSAHSSPIRPPDLSTEGENEGSRHRRDGQRRDQHGRGTEREPRDRRDRRLEGTVTPRQQSRVDLAGRLPPGRPRLRPGSRGSLAEGFFQRAGRSACRMSRSANSPSASGRSDSLASPVMCTCRPRAGQWKRRATWGFTSISFALRVHSAVVKTRASSSRRFKVTVRAEGRPSAPAVTNAHRCRMDDSFSPRLFNPFAQFGQRSMRLTTR